MKYVAAIFAVFTVGVSGYFVWNTLYQREFTEEDVLMLLYGDLYSTAHHRSVVNPIPYARVLGYSPPYIERVESNLRRLIEDVTAVTGVEFTAVALDRAAEARIGLYYPDYETPEQFDGWLEAKSNFSSSVMNDSKEPQTAVLVEGLFGPLLRALLNPDGDVKEFTAEEVLGIHTEYPACRNLQLSAFRYGNRALATFSHLGTNSTELEMLACFVRPFLSAAGLFGARELETPRLLVKTQTGYEFSQLVRCGLSVVSDPQLDNALSPDNSSSKNAIEVMKRLEECS